MADRARAPSGPHHRHGGRAQDVGDAGRLGQGLPNVTSGAVMLGRREVELDGGPVPPAVLGERQPRVAQERQERRARPQTVGREPVDPGLTGVGGHGLEQQRARARRVDRAVDHQTQAQPTRVRRPPRRWRLPHRRRPGRPRRPCGPVPRPGCAPRAGREGLPSAWPVRRPGRPPTPGRPDRPAGCAPGGRRPATRRAPRRAGSAAGPLPAGRGAAPRRVSGRPVARSVTSRAPAAPRRRTVPGESPKSHRAGRGRRWPCAAHPGQ